MTTPVIGVFEGGGIKGIALAGAAAAAIETGYEFEAVVGTSAGALVGSLIVAGYSSKELRERVCRLNWSSLMDPGPIGSIPGIGKHLALILRKGMYRGDVIEQVWSKLLAERGIRTFADVLDGKLRIVATDLTHTRGIVLPNDLESYGIDPGSFPVATAVRMSSSVPFIFQPVSIHDRRTGDVSHIADGGLAAKFPIQVAPLGPHPIIGFRLTDDSSSHPHRVVRGPASLAAAVVSSGMAARQTLPILCNNVDRVVTIAVARDPLDFDLTRHEAGTMFDHGYNTAIKYFDRHPIGVQVP
jgi:NTE family protein